ncbi:MAG: hypothetical protein F6K36_14655 [Symploca sp. SIO3C6]|nr:hypothetical protein [Symploca sp. SIO3C6]NET03665.1 hypothetical protein [Symploca sp. SIO2B6]
MDMAQTKSLDKSLLLSFGEFEGRVGITKNLIERVKMFENKTERIKSSPSTKAKLIYTTNYITKAISCAFTNDPSNELKGYAVEQSSETLSSCFNHFFSECSQTKHIFVTNAEDLTVDEIDRFKHECILGRSVVIEILGRLLHCIYDQSRFNFKTEKVSQLAQLDWSTAGQLWNGNIVNIDPNPKNPAKRYKISAGASPVRMAVSVAKASLGWM